MVRSKSETVLVHGGRREGDRSFGAGAACLVQISDGELGARYRLRDRAVLGRSPDVQIQLTSHDISREHAEVVRLESGRWVVNDLGSSNGTAVNGIPVDTEPRELQFGDRVRLGSTTVLVFTLADPTEEQLARVQKMQAVGQIAAGVAHNFNNLLTVLLGNIAELRTRVPQDEEVGTCLQDMHNAAISGVELARELLGIVRSEEPVTAGSPIDLYRLARDTVRLLEPGMPDGVSVATSGEPGIIVSGHYGRLQQVLTNLVINAKEAVKDGGSLSVSVETRDADPAYARSASVEHEAVLTVEDDGVGMDEVTLSRIFEPFFTTRPTGTGLGLSSVWRTVRDHGGRVRVESELGEGTTFWIYLPLSLPEEEALMGTPHIG